MLQVRRPPVCPPVRPHDSVGGSAERAGGSILAPRPPPAHLRRAPPRPAVLDRAEGAAHRRRATSLAQLGQDMTAARRAPPVRSTVATIAAHAKQPPVWAAVMGRVLRRDGVWLHWRRA